MARKDASQTEAKVMKYFFSNHFGQTLEDLHQIWNILLIKCEYNGEKFVSVAIEDMEWTIARVNGLGMMLMKQMYFFVCKVIVTV
jgi:hypothetical protein